MPNSEPEEEPRDDAQQPEDLGPHLQSELDELLSGLDEQNQPSASADDEDTQPAAPLPSGPTSDLGDGLDDLGPHLRSELHELLGEELPSDDPSSLGDLADVENPLLPENLDLESGDESWLAEHDPQSDLEPAIDDQVEAELEAFLSEDGAEMAADAGLIEERELLLDQNSLEAAIDNSADQNGSLEGDGDDIYDDGVIDAVSLDEYQDKLEQGELDEIGYQEDDLGLSWAPDEELTEEALNLQQLEAEIAASEALLQLGDGEFSVGHSSDLDEDSASNEALFEDQELLGLEQDSVAEIEPLAPDTEVEFDGAESTDALDDLLEVGIAEASEAQPELGDELFEDPSPASELDAALAAEEFDVDEDLFDFASLESGGGFAADDALDIEEFLEAVGEGESFGSMDSEEVEALADGGSDEIEQGDSSELEPLGELDAELLQDQPAQLENASTKGRKRKRRSSSKAQPAERVLVGTSGPTWAWWLAGIAILIGTNFAVASFLQSDRDLARHNLEEARVGLAEATAELSERRAEDARFLADARQPLVMPDPDATSAFANVHRALEEQDFTLARRRLYALLSTIDRRESEEDRTHVEAKAAFMLAEVDHQEAQARGERQ